MEDKNQEDKNQRPEKWPEKSETTIVATKEIRRQNLLHMAKLSSDLKDNDVLFLSNRGQIDAVIIDPHKALYLLGNAEASCALISAIISRIQKDNVPNITDRDRLILAAINSIGRARLIEIADYVKIESSNIHRRLKRLSESGIISRSDKNDITYSITDLGLKILSSN